MAQLRVLAFNRYSSVMAALVGWGLINHRFPPGSPSWLSMGLVSFNRKGSQIKTVIRWTQSIQNICFLKSLFCIRQVYWGRTITTMEHIMYCIVKCWSIHHISLMYEMRHHIHNVWNKRSNSIVLDLITAWLCHAIGWCLDIDLITAWTCHAIDWCLVHWHKRSRPIINSWYFLQ